MTRTILAFREIGIHRAAGFERGGFVVPGLSPGINIIYGPNGVGKSTTARAVTHLIWPALEGSQRRELEGVVRVGEEVREVVVEGRHGRWSADGVAVPAPRLPAPEAHHRYRIALHDLLRDDRTDFAAVIAREAAGGYDLETAARRLEPRPPANNRNAGLAAKFRQARSEYSKAVRSQEALKDSEDELTALRRDLEQAVAARSRLAGLQAARDHARALEREVEARSAVESYEAGMERVGGREYADLCEYRERLRKTREERRQAEKARVDATAARDALGLPADALKEERLPGLQKDIARLKDAEQAVGRARKDHAETREALEKELQRLGKDVPAEGVAAIDLAGIGNLSALVARSEEARNRLATLDEQIRLLRRAEGDGEREDFDRLRTAIEHLRRWLAEPAPATLSGPTFGERAPGLTAALLLTIVAVVLGVTVHPLFYLVGFVGLILLGLQLFVRRAAPADDGRAVLRRFYEQTGLEAPASWDREAVAAVLDRLEERQAAAQVAAESRRRRDDLEAGRAEAEARAAQVAAEVEQLTGRLGIDVAGVSGLAWLVEAVGRCQGCWTEAEAAAAALRSAEDEVESIVSGLRSRLEPLGFTDAVTPGELVAAVGTLSDRLQRHREWEIAIRGATEKVESLDGQADRVAGDIDGIFARLGLEADRDETVKEWCDLRDEYQKARDAHREARAQLDAALDRMRVHGADPELEQLPEADLQSMIDRAEGLAAPVSELTATIAATEALVREAMRSHNVEAALEERDRATATLVDAREVEVRSAIAYDLVQALERSTRDHQLPAVFLRAREHFSRITHGRYELRMASQQQAGFTAYDTVEGRIRALDELSSGTRVQLLLAVRVAFVEEQEDGVLLPIILDEVLANSDEERARAIMEAVVELARGGRQVLYFTAQVADVARWRAAAAAALPEAVELNEIDLEQVRSGERRLQIPASVPPARRLPPAPDGLDHVAYGRLLDVPRLVRWGTPPGAVHLWYMVDEVEQLHELLRLGADRWGPLQALLRDGGRVLVGDGLGERLEVIGRAVGAILEAAAVGVGRPVDRDVLEASGAVSDTFIDRVTTLCTELNGDATRLVDALGEGGVPRFQKQSTNDLREYLVEHRHLPLEEPLELSSIRARVLARFAADITAGRLTLDELNGLLERLWVGVGGDDGNSGSERPSDHHAGAL